MSQLGSRSTEVGPPSEAAKKRKKAAPRASKVEQLPSAVASAAPGAQDHLEPRLAVRATRNKSRTSAAASRTDSFQAVGSKVKHTRASINSALDQEPMALSQPLVVSSPVAAPEPDEPLYRIDDNKGEYHRLDDDQERMLNSLAQFDPPEPDLSWQNRYAIRAIYLVLFGCVAIEAWYTKYMIPNAQNGADDFGSFFGEKVGLSVTQMATLATVSSVIINILGWAGNWPSDVLSVAVTDEADEFVAQFGLDSRPDSKDVARAVDRAAPALVEDEEAAAPAGEGMGDALLGGDAEAVRMRKEVIAGRVKAVDLFNKAVAMTVYTSLAATDSMAILDMGGVDNNILNGVIQAAKIAGAISVLVLGDTYYFVFTKMTPGTTRFVEALHDLKGLAAGMKLNLSLRSFEKFSAAVEALGGGLMLSLFRATSGMVIALQEGETILGLNPMQDRDAMKALMLGFGATGFYVASLTRALAYKDKYFSPKIAAEIASGRLTVEGFEQLRQAQKANYGWSKVAKNLFNAVGMRIAPLAALASRHMDPTVGNRVGLGVTSAFFAAMNYSALRSYDLDTLALEAHKAGQKVGQEIQAFDPSGKTAEEIYVEMAKEFETPGMLRLINAMNFGGRTVRVFMLLGFLEYLQATCESIFLDPGQKFGFDAMDRLLATSGLGPFVQSVEGLNFYNGMKKNLTRLRARWEIGYPTVRMHRSDSWTATKVIKTFFTPMIDFNPEIVAAAYRKMHDQPAVVHGPAITGAVTHAETLTLSGAGSRVETGVLDETEDLTADLTATLEFLRESAPAAASSSSSSSVSAPATRLTSAPSAASTVAAAGHFSAQSRRQSAEGLPHSASFASRPASSLSGLTSSQSDLVDIPIHDGTAASSTETGPSSQV